MSLYYAATFSQEHRHHFNKSHHTFFVFCIKRREFLVPLITFFPSGLNLAHRGFHVLTASVNGEGFLYMQFKTNYRVLHTYVDQECVINEQHTHHKVSIKNTVQLGEETWANQGKDVQSSTHEGGARLE
jgi:hypothetical protein